MNSFGKFLTIAIVAVGCSIAVAPMASACGDNGVLNQPVVIDSSLTQPSVIDNIGGSCDSCGVMTQPAVIDNTVGSCGVLTQPAVIDNGCCGGTMLNPTLVQPALIDNSYALPPVIYGGGYRHHHLFGLDTPFFGFHLF